MRSVGVAVLVGCAHLLAGCSRRSEPAEQRPAEAAVRPASFGDVMAHVGRRFELSGRAAQAGRFELCAFEVDELGELFEDVLPHAMPPKVSGGIDLAGVADAFLKTHPPELARAAKAQDGAAFAGAFARAAQTCNACHEATGHAFIEVPTELGAAVPRLDPVPAASARP
jgi:hypothetical protein